MQHAFAPTCLLALLLLWVLRTANALFAWNAFLHPLLPLNYLQASNDSTSCAGKLNSSSSPGLTSSGALSQNSHEKIISNNDVSSIQNFPINSAPNPPHTPILSYHLSSCSSSDDKIVDTHSQLSINSNNCNSSPLRQSTPNCSTMQGEVMSTNPSSNNFTESVNVDNSMANECLDECLRPKGLSSLPFISNDN